MAPPDRNLSSSSERGSDQHSLRTRKHPADTANAPDAFRACEQSTSRGRPNLTALSSMHRSPSSAVVAARPRTTAIAAHDAPGDARLRDRKMQFERWNRLFGR